MKSFNFIREYINDNYDKKYSLADIKELKYMPHIELSPIIPYINDLKNLEHLYAVKTKPIEELELKLPNLKILSLANLNLNKLSLKCPSLERLNLKNNLLNVLPQINKLEFLNIEQNPLSSLKELPISRIQCGHKSLKKVLLSPLTRGFSCLDHSLEEIQFKYEPHFLHINKPLTLSKLDSFSKEILDRYRINYELREDSLITNL